jgi:hypothetical protein
MNEFFVINAEDIFWSEIFKELPEQQQDVFFSQFYAVLCQKFFYMEHEVFAAVQKTSKAILIYPFVKRDLRVIINRKDVPNYFDIRGLYGRSGLAATSHDSFSIQLFWENFYIYCDNNSIFSSFSRLHPNMMETYNDQSRFITRQYGSEVVVDTSMARDDILINANHSVRKNWKKSLQNEFVFNENIAPYQIDNLYILYLETLKRNSARDFYNFSYEFFLSLIFDNNGLAKLYYATFKESIITFEIILLNGIYAHSYLGGTSSEFLKKQANTFLKVNIFDNLKKIGIKNYLLGGGTSENDQIFKYKSSFAPYSIKSSYIETSVLNPKKYQEIYDFCKLNNLNITENRVQFYDNS